MTKISTRKPPTTSLRRGTLADRLKRNGSLVSAALLAVVSGVACSDGEGDATIEVLLEAEDVVLEGLQPGEELENIADGWAVDFDQYILAVGDVDLHLSEDEETEAEEESIYAVDLTTLEASGLVLWTFDGLEEGRWQFGYSVQGDDAQQHESVSDADFEALVDNDWSYLIRGSLSQSGGVSCPPTARADVPDDAVSAGENEGGDSCYENESVEFDLGVSAESAFGPCEIDGISGVAATSGSTTTAAITIHGDHLFFNGFPEGSEGGILRLAQWLADCDLNLDGLVTMEELAEIAPADLPEIDDRYQLGGSPITPLDNMADYVEAQLMTQGHFQGEGECALNGESHDH